MARVTGMGQCPKCGTWRKRGLELLTHIDICRSFRCHGCGMPRTQHGDHYCTAEQYEAAQKTKRAQPAAKDESIPWTHDRIKNELPDVQVKIGKHVETGKLTRRNEAYALVSLYKTGAYRSGIDLLMTIEYSWNAIYNSLNTGKPLRA